MALVGSHLGCANRKAVAWIYSTRLESSPIEWDLSPTRNCWYCQNGSTTLVSL